MMDILHKNVCNDSKSTAFKSKIPRLIPGYIKSKANVNVHNAPVPEEMVTSGVVVQEIGEPEIKANFAKRRLNPPRSAFKSRIPRLISGAMSKENINLNNYSIPDDIVAVGEKDKFAVHEKVDVIFKKEGKAVRETFPALDKVNVPKSTAVMHLKSKIPIKISRFSKFKGNINVHNVIDPQDKLAFGKESEYEQKEIVQGKIEAADKNEDQTGRKATPESAAVVVFQSKIPRYNLKTNMFETNVPEDKVVKKWKKDEVAVQKKVGKNRDEDKIKATSGTDTVKAPQSERSDTTIIEVEKATHEYTLLHPALLQASNENRKSKALAPLVACPLLQQSPVIYSDVPAPVPLKFPTEISLSHLELKTPNSQMLQKDSEVVTIEKLPKALVSVASSCNDVVAQLSITSNTNGEGCSSPVLQECPLVSMRFLIRLLLKLLCKRRDEVNCLTKEVDDLKRSSSETNDRIRAFEDRVHKEQKQNEELDNQLKSVLEGIDSIKSANDKLVATATISEEENQQEYDALNMKVAQMQSELFNALKNERALLFNLSNVQREAQSLEMQKKEIADKMFEVNSEYLQKEEILRKQLNKTRDARQQIKNRLDDLEEQNLEFLLNEKENTLQSCYEKEARLREGVDELRNKIDILEQPLLKVLLSNSMSYLNGPLNFLYWVAFYTLPALNYNNCN